MLAIYSRGFLFSEKRQVALDRAAHLMDSVVFGDKGWDSVREELAEVSYCDGEKTETVVRMRSQVDACVSGLGW